MNSFYSPEELKDLGLKSFGQNVLISRKVSIYGAARIEIGSNVRIDDYCVIAAGKQGIAIGSNVHIAIFCSIQGNGKVQIDDYCGLSSRTAIYSSTDDYSGAYLTNPTVSELFTSVTDGDVHLHKHVIIGSGCVVLPNVTIGLGAAIGALSLVNRNCESFFIYQGNPIKKLFPREQNILQLEKLHKLSLQNDNE